jgi:hypothetical protein
MAQRAEYMNISTSLADDETRKWIKFKARAESMDKSERAPGGSLTRSGWLATTSGPGRT